jgi:hypothetical protein
VASDEAPALAVRLPRGADVGHAREVVAGPSESREGGSTLADVAEGGMTYEMAREIVAGLLLVGFGLTALLCLLLLRTVK